MCLSPATCLQGEIGTLQRGAVGSVTDGDCPLCSGPGMNAGTARASTSAEIFFLSQPTPPPPPPRRVMESQRRQITWHPPPCTQGRVCLCVCVLGGSASPGKRQPRGEARRGEAAWRRVPRGRVAAEAPLSLRVPPWRGRPGPPHRHQHQRPRFFPRLPARPPAAQGRTEAAPPWRRVSPPAPPAQRPGPAPAAGRGEARGRRARLAACPRPLPGRGGGGGGESERGPSGAVGRGFERALLPPPGGEEESESRGERLRMIT